MRALPNKMLPVIFVIFVVALCLAIENLGTIFFLNRTASMPQGIYIKNGLKYLDEGDMVVFKIASLKGNLIKYILALPEAEFCFDEEGTLWVDDIPQAQKNINKYSSSFIEQSVCETLKADEVLVIGDHPDSYDSRYFGPIRRKDLITKVTLLYPFNGTKE